MVKNDLEWKSREWLHEASYSDHENWVAESTKTLTQYLIIIFSFKHCEPERFSSCNDVYMY